MAEHVRYLSATIGERNILRSGSLKAAADYIRNNLTQYGYPVTEQTYAVEGKPANNLEAELTGSEPSAGTVVLGAHYDTVPRTMGADDNASGVAAALELARLLKGSKFHKTIRFAFFVNEEPPFFQTEQMGSLVYARKLRQERVPVSAMISLETLGFYSDVPGSQKYPAILSLFYPNRGDFIGFVGNTESRDLVRRAIRSFRQSARFPSEGVAAPATWPGIGWSDQWSFWQEGYPAIMITDTAIFRYPYYHTDGDTSERVDFEKMARVVEGASFVVAVLANE
jgi:Zn-dependent M28 family amino/carboxypeptidase